MTMSCKFLTRAPRQCLSKICHNKLFNTSLRNSSAFEPFFYLHDQTVREKQMKTFEKVWDSNLENFKDRMTDNELALMEHKIKKSRSFEDFEQTIKDLMSPQRHHRIRKLRTWAVTNNALYDYAETQHPSNLIFGDDQVFREFFTKYVFDEEDLLRDFEFCDLRYMVANQAIEYLTGIKCTAVFGNRTSYHYTFPCALTHSAKWNLQIYDRIKPREVVFLSCIQGLREDKPLNTEWFKDLLNSVDHNAYKEEEFRTFAQYCTVMPHSKFIDQFDRVFNRFQTTPGVTDLTVRYDTDLNYHAYYDEGALYGEQDHKWRIADTAPQTVKAGGIL